MLRFQHIEYLWLLCVIPFLGICYFFWQKNRKEKIKKIGAEKLVNALIPSFNKNRYHLKFLLWMLSFFCGIVALANLQSAARSEKIQRKGIDLIIALDVSNSMMAKDMNPNRLEKSKQFIFNLIDKLQQNRIGLILFAGNAYMSVPLTVDMTALKMNLSIANPDLVPTQGTVLSDAIEMAHNSFNEKETKYKSILLISDGEDHDKEVGTLVKKAVESGIMINTIGIGSVVGAVIWDEANNENKKDENGNEIISKLNEQVLQSIAKDGKGIYIHLQNTESAATQILKQINSMEQKQFGEDLYVDYKSYFQYFLAACLFFLILDFFIPFRKKNIIL